MFDPEAKCKRLGDCCYFNNPETGVRTKCRNLVILKSGKTLCRIYKHRLGFVLWEKKGFNKIICGTRQQQGTLIAGCDLIKEKEER